MKVPIRVRLTAVYCIVFCCSTLLLGIGSYWGIRSAIYAILDHDLQARVVGVEEFLDEHVGRRTLDRLQAEIRRHEALHPSRLSIVEAGGDSIFHGDALKMQLSSPQLKRGAVRLWTVDASPESMRILATRFPLRGRDYDLILATGLAVPFEILDNARLALLLSAPFILLAASVAGYWISGRALAPVSGLTREARSVGADDLTRRIGVPDTGDELRELALTLNEMLARIDATFCQVTQFTANASHELRTPLALIRTTAEVALLRRNATAGNYRDALHRILAEAERNTALLDHLLFLARADARQMPPKRPVRIGEEVKRICEEVEVLASEKGLRLRLETSGEPLWVAGNAEHLRRLWLVLLDNAVKYTPGGGEVVVTVAPEGPGRIAVAVCDTGIGIAEQDLPHIFERFFRADEARTNCMGGGTGLGLSIARWLVDEHDATISVRSKLGEGSAFCVVFPRLATPAVSMPESGPTRMSVK